MMNRKQIKSVLREWKSFLAEAASSDPLIRIFDFDNTLAVYSDPGYKLITANPYMASFINPDLLQKIYLDNIKIPENLKDIVENTGPNTRNYVISKVASGGMQKPKLDKLIAGLKNASIGSDANFKALAELIIVKEGGVKDWAKRVNSDDPEVIAKFIKDTRNVLNVESTEFADQSKINNDNILMTQEEKIHTILRSEQAEIGVDSKGKKILIDDKINKVFTPVNIAKSNEVPLPGGAGSRMVPEPGTSTKKPYAISIAERSFAEFPDTLITFEIYDNNLANVAQIESGILKASSGEDATEEVEPKSEQGFLDSLIQEINRKENVQIIKFQAIPTGDTVQLRDLSNVHYSKSHDTSGVSKEAGGSVLKYQKLKNKFFKLMNFLKMGGKKTGRPSDKVADALKQTIEQHPNVGEKVKTVFANYISGMGTTGIEDQFTTKADINVLCDQLMDFVKNYSSFKQMFESKKSGSEEPKVSKPKKPKKSEVPATIPEEPPDSDGMDSDAYADYNPGDEYDDAGDDDLRESLNIFKKALKKIL